MILFLVILIILELEYLPLVKIGTGVNTGPCIVGNMGSESRFDYSVVGDAVNLGARLEVQTREYDTPILLSEYTYMQTEGISCDKLDEIKVKGKEELVTIYKPVANLMEGYDFTSEKKVKTNSKKDNKK